MTLTYQLDQNDFLQHQLFLASKIDRIKKKRLKSWLIASGTFFLLGFLFFDSNNPLLAYYFLAFGIVSLIFYPLYQRNQYKSHYAKFISDTYKNRFGQTANIHFAENVIETNDITGESKINLSELENVTETGEYFYPSLRTGGHLIIPKSKISNIPQLRQELRQLCGRLKINYIEDLNWKWK
ncbi:hypothetical protein DC498_09840 [Terrimonas sp.]|uniref:hypothetical protein n=1 Tax=Terrimonas sp. TaxID=1914338 RepID=UPI000D521F3E|nr:hypothetical protein [Terrimonas sp.]PVD52399.1 hypothetical protein DC498_09840 [Terrimonas sp.]